MNNRRKLFVALCVSAVAVPLASLAQQQRKVWRIGFLDLGSRRSRDDLRYVALMEGLQKFGYLEGKNLGFEGRYADGNADRLDGLAEDLIRQKVDLILSQGNPASHAAKRAAATIPIVITNAIDPVGDGFARSLARPGGNITGMSSGAEIGRVVGCRGAKN